MASSNGDNSKAIFLMQKWAVEKLSQNFTKMPPFNAIFCMLVLVRISIPYSDFIFEISLWISLLNEKKKKSLFGIFGIFVNSFAIFLLFYGYD